MIDENDKQPLRLEGAHNLIFIALIIIGVLANGSWPDMFPAFANGAGLHIYDEIVFPYATLAEIAIILVAAFLSIKRRGNRRGTSTNLRMPRFWKC